MAQELSVRAPAPTVLVIDKKYTVNYKLKARQISSLAFTVKSNSIANIVELNPLRLENNTSCHLGPGTSLTAAGKSIKSIIYCGIKPICALLISHETVQ